MAWENFWKLDEKGRRLTTGPQLSAFRTHFPERVVDAQPAIGRPLILVLDRPYKLSRFPGADIYEQKPLRLSDLKGWPPCLSLSTRFGYFPKPGDGDVIDARVVQPSKKGDAPLLLIRGDYQDQEAACTIVGYPPALLECIAETLNDHQGEPFRSLSEIELSGAD